MVQIGGSIGKDAHANAADIAFDLNIKIQFALWGVISFDIDFPLNVLILLALEVISFGSVCANLESASSNSRSIEFHIHQHDPCSVLII